MPIALTYDTLPPMSRLRRDVSDDGSVTIIAPAGEIGELSRGAAMQSTAWGSAACVGVIIALLGAFALPVVITARLTPGMRVLLYVFSGIFFVALFLLIWRDRYGQAMQRLEQSARQLSALNVSRGRIDIETSGPFGDKGVSVRAPIEWRIGRVGQSRLLALFVGTGNDNWCAIFPGLTRRELLWIGAEIDRVAQT